jgi:hypothetical protein
MNTDLFGYEPQYQPWEKLDAYTVNHPEELSRLIQAARDAKRHFGGWTIHMARDICAIRHKRSVSRSLLPGYAREIMRLCPDLKCITHSSKFGQGRPRP